MVARGDLSWFARGRGAIRAKGNSNQKLCSKPHTSLPQNFAKRAICVAVTYTLNANRGVETQKTRLSEHRPVSFRTPGRTLGIAGALLSNRSHSKRRSSCQ